MHAHKHVTGKSAFHFLLSCHIQWVSSLGIAVLHSLTSMKESCWVQPHLTLIPAFISTIVMVEFISKTHKWLKLLQTSLNYPTMMGVHSQFLVHLTVREDSWASWQKLPTSIELCHWCGNSIPGILGCTVMYGHWIMLWSLYSMRTVLEQFWRKTLRTWSEFNLNYFVYIEHICIHTKCSYKRTN